MVQVSPTRAVAAAMAPETWTAGEVRERETDGERGTEKEKKRERERAKVGGICLLPARASEVPAMVPASRMYIILEERRTVALANALGCVPSGHLELRTSGPDRADGH